MIVFFSYLCLLKKLRTTNRKSKLIGEEKHYFPTLSAGQERKKDQVNLRYQWEFL